MTRLMFKVLMSHLRLKANGMTPLAHVAGWCLWITVWGPIFNIMDSFRDYSEYSFFIRYRQVVFSALLIQICLRLAQPTGLKLWKTAALVLVAGLLNPIWLVHFGVAWPWRIVNAATAVISFMAVAEVNGKEYSQRKNLQYAASERSNDAKSLPWISLNMTLRDWIDKVGNCPLHEGTVLRTTRGIFIAGSEGSNYVGQKREDGGINEENWSDRPVDPPWIEENEVIVEFADPPEGYPKGCYRESDGTIHCICE